MKTLLLLLFVCPFLSVNATTYYFSSSGNDSRSAAQARNSSTPWRTLSKLNSIFYSLQPGDAVLLKRGDIFYGSITVRKSGTSSSPIVIGAYGSGDKPVITSLVRLSNWVSKGHGIWESYNSNLASTVNTVLSNDVEQEMGRYPNSDADNKGYLSLESHNGLNSITDNQLTSRTNWTGAELVLRARRWVINRNLITRHSGSTLTYSTSSWYEAKNGYGYFIQNSIKTLDKPGEWYYNPSTKKLSMFFGSNNPSSYNIQATTEENLIQCVQYNNIVIDNINIKGTNGSAVFIRFGQNITITNCDILFSGIDGVVAKYAKNFRIENSTIANSNNNGINLGYAKDNAVIRNNKIINTSLFAGMGQSGDGQGNAIFSYGNNTIIEYNQIINTGFIGVSFNGDNVTIKNNLIDNFCMTKDDGAGIYTFTGSVNSNQKGRKLIGNIILNGKGAWSGTSLPVTYSAEGIYLDNGAAGVELSDNSIANCSNNGVFLHNAHAITMSNNTIYNSDIRQLVMIENPNHPKMRNCNISDNIFFSDIAKQKNIYLLSGQEGTRYFGKIKGNHYARPLDFQSDYYQDKIKAIEPGAKLVSFVNAVRFEYNATGSDKTIALDGSYVDVKNNKYANSVTLPPYSSVVLIKSSVSFSHKAPVVNLTSPASNTTFKSGATININANATDADGTVSKVEFYNGNTLLATDYTRPYSYSWNNVQKGNYGITAKATDNNGLATTSDKVWVSVAEPNKEATIRIVKPIDQERFTGPATIRLIADADAGNSGINKVEFYNGNDLLRIERKYPYTYWWRGVNPGTYTITAVLTTDNGNWIRSKSVQVTVVGNKESRPGTNGNNTTEAAINTDSINAASVLKPLDNSTLNLKLSPNPARNILNVVTGGLPQDAKRQVSVMSVSGVVIKTIQSNTSNQNIQLDVSTLGSGIYIIKIVSGDKILSKQFVKL